MRTKSGRLLSEADVDRLAASAEAGFDLTTWKTRPGRPPLEPGLPGHAPRVAARVSRPVYEKAVARAASEGRSISEVVRGLLEEYASPVGTERGGRR